MAKMDTLDFSETLVKPAPQATKAQLVTKALEETLVRLAAKETPA
jgi:hypothetical protein